MSNIAVQDKGDQGSSGADGSRLRLTLGRDLVALGFIVVVAALGMALLFFSTAADVAAAIAPVTTLVGTLIGTVFGVQAATQGQAGQTQAAQQTTTSALQLAVQAATLLPDGQQEAMLERIREASNSTANGNPSIEVF